MHVIGFQGDLLWSSTHLHALKDLRDIEEEDEKEKVIFPAKAVDLAGILTMARVQKVEKALYTKKQTTYLNMRYLKILYRNIGGKHYDALKWIAKYFSILFIMIFS